MAIIFSKDISQANLLMTYNNNIVVFSSSNILNPLYCKITGNGIDALIYPHPDGNFYFNFIDYISAEINTKNFADDLVTNLLNTDITTFTYNISDGRYLNVIVTFEITLSNNSKETITRNLQFIAGVNQIEDYKKQEIKAINKFTILSPVANRSDNSVDLKYWEGYPFSFSVFSNDVMQDFKFKNNSNGLDNTFDTKGKITSVILDDGNINLTNSNILPLIKGINELEVYINNINQNLNININKVDSTCGTYIKWLNKFGSYNYWLLSEFSKRTRSTKYGVEINNDFNNLENTTSPTLQSGKSNVDLLKCNVKKLTQSEKDVLIGVLESPKIYLFNGERFSKAEPNDWIEVTLKNNSLEVEDSIQKTFRFNLDFELPNRYSQKL